MLNIVCVHECDDATKEREVRDRGFWLRLKQISLAAVSAQYASVFKIFCSFIIFKSISLFQISVRVETGIYAIEKV